jgi:Caspase domain
VELKLCVSSDSRSGESLQHLTREFCAHLQRDGRFDAKIPEAACAPGAKGDPITIGSVLLTLLSSGAVTALLHVIKAYCERESGLSFEIQRPDGEKVVVSGRNLSVSDLQKAMCMAEDRLRPPGGISSSRYAVLIASSIFPQEPLLAPLACPERDVDGLSAVLSSPRLGGFDNTEVLKNRPHFEVLRRIDGMLKRAGRDDLALIYYSGHGKLDAAGRLHLATADTEIDALQTTSIPLQRIRELMDVTASTRIVLILDCCFSGAVNNIFRSGLDDQLNLLSSGRGTYIMTASTAIETAQEKEGDDYGLFTKHLIRGIGEGEADRDGDGYVTIDELYDYVHRGVVNEGYQKPMKWSINVEGEIRIASSGRNSRQERARALKAMLFELNSAGHIPDALFCQALDVIACRRASLTDVQRRQDALLDRLLQGGFDTGDFIWKWLEAQYLDVPALRAAADGQGTAANDKGATRGHLSKSWQAFDLVKTLRTIRHPDEELAQSMGELRQRLDRMIAKSADPSSPVGRWRSRKQH